MSVSQAIACATVNAARTFEVFRDRGTLNVGAVADVALLELREGSFEFLDNCGNKIPGRHGARRETDSARLTGGSGPFR